MVVVIPCFNEVSLVPVFESLQKCAAPNKVVEILAIVNASESTSPDILSTNHKCAAEAKAWVSDSGRNERISFHVAEFNELPQKHAGVGLARKIGMDEAVRRLEQSSKDGVIVNLDVDCTVSENYFVAIEQHFETTNCDGCGLHFEHVFKNEPGEIQHAIIQYELYLRYFINMQRIIGFPWAYQTIGSAMGVRSSVYQAQGGMNRRKAGEDFYFLQKIIELGRFSELNTATVFPSSRQSDRVPFGTGKAVNDIIERNGSHSAYHPNSFIQLNELFKLIPELFDATAEKITGLIAPLPSEIREYLSLWGFTEKVVAVNSYTSDEKGFIKRFYRDFNAFQLMKYLHWMRDAHFPNVKVMEAITHLFNALNLSPLRNETEILYQLREFDKNYGKT